MAPALRLVDKPADAERQRREAELVRVLDEEITSGITFENDDKVGAQGLATRKGERDTALDYYDGVMADLPAETGRSSIVSRDVADVLDTMLPGLMRVFAGADKVVVYAPQRPGDEESAAQATDYVNHVWANECGGYKVLLTWITDALQVRNGVVKAFWDPTPEHETEDLSGLDETQITILLEDPEVEVQGANPRTEIIRDPATGQSMPLQVYDLRVRRVVSSGRLVIDNVAPDDFGITRDARSIAKARTVWHRSRVTRSDLIEQGYPRDIVEDLPAYRRPASSRSDAERNDERERAGTIAAETGATAEIEIVEAYTRFDWDGDGIAEMLKVVTGGYAGSRTVLSADPWPDEVPFVDLTPQPVPHRWQGKAVYDLVGDLQRVKTALMRATLDSVYAQALPQAEVLERAIVNPDELLNRGFGGRYRVTEREAVRYLTVPDTSRSTLQAVQYVDSVVQRRTGISNATMALDSTALEPQTATAEQIEHDASYSRVELIARNMAEIGLKELFAKVLRILVRHQDRPRTIRLRDKWVDFDPRAWNASMDASINVGLGTGSRERDLKMLAGVRASQEQIIKELGPGNPIVRPGMYVSTLHKMVEASGLKEPEQFFATLTDEQFAQWQATRPPPPPDPRVAAVQAKAQADQQKLQADTALRQQRDQIDLAAEREKTAAEIEMRGRELQAEFAQKQDQMQQEFALRLQEMHLEAQLKAEQIAYGAPGGDPTNVPRAQ